MLAATLNLPLEPVAELFRCSEIEWGTCFALTSSPGVLNVFFASIVCKQNKRLKFGYERERLIFLRVFV